MVRFVYYHATLQMSQEGGPAQVEAAVPLLFLQMWFELACTLGR